MTATKRILSRLLAAIRPPRNPGVPPRPIPHVGIIPEGYQVVLVCPPTMPPSAIEALRAEFHAAREAYARGETRPCMVWGVTAIVGIPPLTKPEPAAPSGSR